MNHCYLNNSKKSKKKKSKILILIPLIRLCLKGKNILCFSLSRNEDEWEILEVEKMYCISFLLFDIRTYYNDDKCFIFFVNKCLNV